ncbi:MAG: hypothetical protein ACYCUG_00205 [Acidimicrobiales bacterium]
MPEVLGLVVPGALYGLAALACPVGMGAMMWLMMRGGRHNQQLGQPPMPMGSSFDPGMDRESELARMRAEIDQLRAAQAERDSGPTVELQ